MKTITKYEALDGTQFDTVAQCQRHENLITEIQRIMLPILPRPDSLIGDEYFQWNFPDVLKIQRSLIEVFERECFKDAATTRWRESTNIAGMSTVGRYMDECAPRVLNAAWHRIMCMDSLAREYSQPYFAIRANHARGLLT
jgi:hypothetical protein